METRRLAKSTEFLSLQKNFDRLYHGSERMTLMNNLNIIMRLNVKDKFFVDVQIYARRTMNHRNGIFRRMLNSRKFPRDISFS